MAARKPFANNHLEEAMALLIRNQAAFVEQISRNDQERLALQRQTEEWQRKSEEWQRKSDEWQRKSEERFARIEAPAMFSRQLGQEAFFRRDCTGRAGFLFMALRSDRRRAMRAFSQSCRVAHKRRIVCLPAGLRSHLV